MSLFIRFLRSEFEKSKHTHILIEHIIFSVVTSAVFLLYFTVSPWSNKSKIAGYLEFFAIALPTMVGLFCAKAADLEAKAGNFQNILGGVKSRGTMFLSKFAFVFILGAFSVFSGIGIFGVCFGVLPFIFYLKVIGLLVLSNIFIYIFHLFLSLAFGRGATIGTGIGESLICALMLTGLGDGKWYFIPASWGARFCDCLIVKNLDSSYGAIVYGELQRGLIFLFVYTAIALVLSLFWFSKWEGRKTFD